MWDNVVVAGVCRTYWMETAGQVSSLTLQLKTCWCLQASSGGHTRTSGRMRAISPATSCLVLRLRIVRKYKNNDNLFLP